MLGMFVLVKTVRLRKLASFFRTGVSNTGGGVCAARDAFWECWNN